MALQEQTVRKSPGIQALELARHMVGYTVKISDENSPGAAFAVIQTTDSPISILCKKHKNGILLTDGGETFKMLAEPIYSYMETMGKGDHLNPDLLAFTLKALIKKEVRIQNRELGIIIPSYDPSYFLSGCIALFTCIKGVSSLSLAMSDNG